MNHRILSLLTLIGLIGFGCSGPTEPVAIASIQVTAPSSNLASGATVQLTAATLGKNGKALTDRIVTWSSSNQTIATVSATGLVTAGSVLGGTAESVTITASAEGITGTAALTVNPAIAASVSITAASTAVSVGDSLVLAATAKDVNGNTLTNRQISWKSSDSLIAKVSPTGKVIPQFYAGPLTRPLTITAEIEGKSATIDINVRPLSVSSIAVSVPAGALFVKGTKQLNVSLKHTSGADLIDRAISYTTTDTTNISVSSSGLVQAKRAGTATIRIESEGIIASTAITVHSGLAPATIASGEWHVCAIAENTGTYCWGDNNNGQLGDGTYAQRNQPVRVQTAEKFIALSAGAQFTCGLTELGDIFCWGIGGYLGDGTGTQRNVPARVSGSLRFKQLSSGYSNTCGVTNDGKVYCWGSNAWGLIDAVALINRTGFTYLIPTHISVPENIEQVTVAAAHACAVSETGQVYCWGWERNGRLGNDGFAADAYRAPATIAGSRRYVSLAASVNNTCAISVSGETFCWGDSGANGINTAEQQPTPQRVSTPSQIVALQTLPSSRAHCGFDSQRELYCWGSSQSGQFGFSSNSWILEPTKVASPPHFSSLSMNSQTCGIAYSGSVYCWGAPGAGLGNGTSLPDTRVPTLIAGSTQFSKVSASGDYACALAKDEAVYCWGNNATGQLGDGTTSSRYTPTRVVSEERFSDVVTSTWHTCGLTISQKVLCWGSNLEGYLGDGTSAYEKTSPDFKTLPTEVTGGYTFTAIARGDRRTCALTAAQKAFCWGINWSGQLGDGTDAYFRSSPTAVATTATFVSLASRDKHTCGLTSAGEAYCWGWANGGNLGSVETGNQNKPVRAVPQMTFTQIITGLSHTCGIAVSGPTHCWGINFSGQYGDGTTSECGLTWCPNGTFPAQVAGGLPFSRLYGGSQGNCALTAGGEAYCWGNVWYGTVDGIRSNNPVPVASAYRFATMSVGSGATCAITTESQLYCWGSIPSGDIFAPRLLPEVVSGGIVFRTQ